MALTCGYEHLILKLLLLTSVVTPKQETKKIFTAHDGGEVDIHCPYMSNYETNMKYLCRGECLRVNKNKVVESGGPAEDRRFSLTDNTTRHIFTVTITDLRTEDGGKYWCGVQTGLGSMDDFTEVLLEVKPVSRVSGVAGQHLTISCGYEKDLKDNVKFFCKGSDPVFCGTSTVKVTSDSKVNGRFSLTDDMSAGVFKVTISDLKEEDSGIYWCGVTERSSLEQKNKWISVSDLNISKVNERTTSSVWTTTIASSDTSKPATSNRPDTSSLPSSSSSSSSSSPILSSKSSVTLTPDSGSSVFVMLIVTGILMCFGLLFFMYFRWRRRKEGTKSRDVVERVPRGDVEMSREPVSVYEEIGDALCRPEVPPELGEDDAHVYTLAKFPSSSSDHLNYSTVRFHTTHRSDRTSDARESCDYDTVKP